MSQMARTRKASDPPAVMLDWLPWNHTMGGNATFQGNLAEGGTTYIDDGKPLPGLFEETLRNLREISPTYFANVPAGYAMCRSNCCVAIVPATPRRRWYRVSISASTASRPACETADRAVSA